MSIPRALSVVFGCAVFCGAAGAALGYAIGRWWPDAYRVWAAPGAQFSPVQVGLGLAQGLLLGLGAGIAVLAIVAWHDVRMARVRREERESIYGDL